MSSKNNKKALIFDIDCTLLNNGCKLDYNEIIDIVQFPKNGGVSKDKIKFLISSGRMTMMSNLEHDERKIDDDFRLSDRFLGLLNSKSDINFNIVDIENYNLFHDLIRDSSNGKKLKEYYDNQTKRFQKFMEQILNDDNIDFYIVTTRPLVDIPDELFNTDGIIDESVLDEFIIDYEDNYIMSGFNFDLKFQIFQKLSRRFNCRTPKEVYKLNSDPSTRWLYYLNMAESWNEETDQPEPLLVKGRINDKCRYQKFKEKTKQLQIKSICTSDCVCENENFEHSSIQEMDPAEDFEKEEVKTFRLPYLSLDGSNYGGFQSGVIKILQLIDILQLGGYKPENMFFFDDAKHNYQAWCYFSLFSEDISKFNFIKGNNIAKMDHQWVFGRKNIFQELNDKLGTSAFGRRRRKKPNTKKKFILHNDK